MVLVERVDLVSHQKKKILAKVIIFNSTTACTAIQPLHCFETDKQYFRYRNTQLDFDINFDYDFCSKDYFTGNNPNIKNIDCNVYSDSNDFDDSFNKILKDVDGNFDYEFKDFNNTDNNFRLN